LQGSGLVTVLAGANTCVAGKTKCVRENVAGLLRCHADAARNGTDLEPACVMKVATRFDGAFRVPPDPARGCVAAREARQDVRRPETLCRTRGDARALQEKVDAFIGDVVAALDPGARVGGQGVCAAAKLQCVRKQVVGLLTCRARCQRNPRRCGEPSETACVRRVRAAYEGGAAEAMSCFARAERKGPCVALGERAARDAMAARVDAFVSEMVQTLEATVVPGATPAGEGEEGGEVP
jgi:hypothetical protein